MKRLRILFALLVLALLLLSGCAARSATVTDYVGHYTKPDNATDYTDIRADGTFAFYDKGQSMSGTYKVSGNEITLTVPEGGTAVGRLEPGKIIDNDGQTWVKGSGD